MAIYAYRALLTLGETPTQEQLEGHRGKVRRLIGSWGGDPLPGEQILVRVNEGIVTMQWRSKQPPGDSFVRAITDYAAGLNITAWTLDYHRCGNGIHRSCGRWQRLIEDANG